MKLHDKDPIPLRSEQAEATSEPISLALRRNCLGSALLFFFYFLGFGEAVPVMCGHYVFLAALGDNGRGGWLRMEGRPGSVAGGGEITRGLFGVRNECPISKRGGRQPEPGRKSRRSAQTRGMERPVPYHSEGTLEPQLCLPGMLRGDMQCYMWKSPGAVQFIPHGGPLPRLGGPIYAERVPQSHFGVDSDQLLESSMDAISAPRNATEQ